MNCFGVDSKLHLGAHNLGVTAIVVTTNLGIPTLVCRAAADQLRYLAGAKKVLPQTVSTPSMVASSRFDEGEQRLAS
jgi:hypothetical protein